MTELATAEQQQDPQVSDDAALEAIWNQQERDNGAARDDAGKFANGNAEPETQNGAEQGKDGGGNQAAEDPAQAQTAEGQQAAQTVQMPANWQGLDAEWSKIPADIQAKIAEHQRDLHTRMSDQGRQIGTLKPIAEIVDQNKDLYEGKKTADGRDVTPAFAMQFLFNAQRELSANPIGTLIKLADQAGVRQHLAAALLGQMPVPVTPQPAGLTPADVERMISQRHDEEAQVRAWNDELSRLSKDKPLYSDIPEEDMVHSITKARARLGETADKQAVFDLAYDMAVNADPDLRAKAAAAKVAAEGDQKRTAAQKRANTVNVTSTSSGKARELTEDELLSATYDEIQNKD